MHKMLIGCLLLLFSSALPLQAQEPSTAQIAAPGQGNPTVQSAVNALFAYTKWRDESLRNFPEGLLTPHYAVAIVAQRLDDHTAQVEMLVAAEMKHYTITIRPVTLARQANGETTTTPVGNAVTINQKAGRKLNPGPDAIRIGDTTTLVAVTRAAQALEITWAPKNDKPDDPSNTCIVRLGREPEVVVNGYVVGAPVR
jgi:hypothetical protein